MNVGQRIKNRRKQLGMSAEQLAEKIGKAPATVYRYENGDISRVDSAKLMPIAEALSTTPAYLMGWEDDKTVLVENNDATIIHTKRIPILGDTAAGLPIVANRVYDEYIDVPMDGRHFDAAVRVNGDSMSPRFEIGDLALIRYQDDVDDGQVAIVCLDDTVTLKRLYHIPHGIVLHSDNPKYKPMVYRIEDVQSIHLTGKVVGVIHWEE